MSWFGKSCILPGLAPVENEVDKNGWLADIIMFSMPNTPTTDGLLLCSGKNCAKKQRGAYKRLRSLAKDAGLDVESIPCQGSCEGPTAVVLCKNGPRWFEELQKREVQVQLVSFASGESQKPAKRVRKRELDGKQKKKAAKRLAKTLEPADC